MRQDIRSSTSPIALTAPFPLESTRPWVLPNRETITDRQCVLRR
jgi:hypothetical protein